MAQIVVDQNGQKHEFPDAATPEMIAAALDVAPPAGSPTPSSGSDLVDMGKNAVTGAAKGIGDLISLPRTVYDFFSSIGGQNDGIDPATGLSYSRPAPPAAAPAGPPGQKPITMDDIAHLLPSREDMNNALFNKLGLPYYVPSTMAGRLGQSAIEGAVGGAPGGPAGMIMGGAGGAAGQAAAEAGAGPGGQIAASILLPLLTAGAGLGVARMGRPLTAAGQRSIAADTLHDVAGGPIVPQAAPVPGTPMTLGQATGNPGVINLERAAFSRQPFVPNRPGEINMPFTKGNMVTDANQSMTTALDRGLGNVPGAGLNTVQAEGASGQMQAAVRAHIDSLRKEERAAWNSISGASLPAAADPIKADLQAVREKLGVANEDLIPSYVDRVIGKWGDTVTFDDLKTLRTRVGNDIEKALSGPQPDRNLAHALSPIEETLRQHMDQLASVDPGVQNQLQAARFATSHLHSITDDPTIASVLEQSGPWDRVGAAAVAGKFIKFGGGSADSYDKFLVAAGNAPAAQQAARDYVTAQMMKTIQGRPLDAGGTPLIVAGNFRKFVNDNRTLIDHPDLYTPAQRDVITRVADQADMLARTQRGQAFGTGGSDTFNKLASDQFLQALVGKGGAATIKILAGTAGYAAMNAVTGPIGGLAGGMGGFALGGKAATSLYANAQRNVITLIDRALTDPAFAVELQQFRSNPTTSNLSPRIRAVLGLTTAATSAGDKRN